MKPEFVTAVIEAEVANSGFIHQPLQRGVNGFQLSAGGAGEYKVGSLVSIGLPGG